jgi:hypothetical protein
MRIRPQGLCDLDETIPNRAFDGLIVLRAAAASSPQRLHRAALDKAPQSVAHHAVGNPRTHMELLRRRTAFLSLQGKDNLDRLLVAEQGGRSAARLS